MRIAGAPSASGLAATTVGVVAVDGRAPRLIRDGSHAGCSATSTTPPASTKRVSAATSRFDGRCCGAISTSTSVAGLAPRLTIGFERPLHDVAETAQQQEPGLAAGGAAREAGAAHAEAFVGRRDHRRGAGHEQHQRPGDEDDD